MQEPYSVKVSQSGRGGTVEYVEGDGRLSFDWEFGGAGAIALIFVPTSVQWQFGPQWGRGRRDEILQRMTDAVIRQQAQGCIAEFDGDGVISISRR